MRLIDSAVQPISISLDNWPKLPVEGKLFKRFTPPAKIGFHNNRLSLLKRRHLSPYILKAIEILESQVILLSVSYLLNDGSVRTLQR
jgi:hypothetical protein